MNAILLFLKVTIASVLYKRFATVYPGLDDLRTSHGLIYIVINLFFIISQAERARKNAEAELGEVNVRISELTIQVTSLTNDKRRLEGDIAAMQVGNIIPTLKGIIEWICYKNATPSFRAISRRAINRLLTKPRRESKKKKTFVYDFLKECPNDSVSEQ